MIFNFIVNESFSCYEVPKKEQQKIAEAQTPYRDSTKIC